MRNYLLNLLIFLLLLFSINIINAQICTGNLGDNIFLEGDFGTGTANILSPNPNIAPGYNYTFNVPPVDGQYVLTNNTGAWSGLYNSWLMTGDNSTDPNGYMMVVNASFDPGLFYEKEVTGLCEGTLYTFTADFLNLIKTGIADHIDPNVSFLLNGVVLFSTGDIPKTQNWITYGSTFTTIAGQETVTLSLRNNAPGGIGNDLAIDNISFQACGPEALILPEEIANICEDESPIVLEATVIGNQYVNPAIQWQNSTDGGLTWMDIVGETGSTYLHTDLASGMYFYRFLLADGAGNLSSEKCRVNSNIKTINIIPKEYIVFDTICDGTTLMVGSSTYTTSGVYVDSLLNFLGCDSVLTTTLTVLTDAGITADFLVNSPSCFNLSDGSIAIENVQNGMMPYQFSFDGIDADGATFFPNLAGDMTHVIRISDFFGCYSETVITIENAPILMLELGQNQVVELGESVVIAPFYNFSVTDFNWVSTTPIDCIDFVDCEKLDFLPTSSQLVTLELIAGNDCSISDSLFIEVIDVRKAYFPNVFSPNNDGINDVFTLFGNSPNVQMVEEFKVFDRWGSLIFDGGNFPPNDLQNGWDGTFNGETLPTGIYIYTTTVRFVDEQVLRYSGDVFLIK